MWLIDGNNVFGARPDGWWTNRPRAMAALTQQVALWCRTHDEPVTLMFDDAIGEAVAVMAGGNLTIERAPRRGRNAADDAIVARAVAERESDETVLVRVVTADKGLRGRLPEGVVVVGVSDFRDRIGY